MAFKKAPEQDTYSTVEFPLIKEQNRRDVTSSSKDIDYLNVTIDHHINKVTGEHELEIVKRCGMALFNQTAISTSRSITGWKLFQTVAQVNYLFVGFDNGDIIVYKMDGTIQTTIAAATTAFTTNGGMGFTEFLYDVGTRKVCVTDGAKLCTITLDGSFTVVQNADADFPTPVLPYITFLDGYLLVVKQDTGDIYNSNLNDPLGWTAGNFITAESAGDHILWLGRLNNYAVVFGLDSIEFFYNAGIATGSPLQVNRTLSKQIGLISKYSLPNYYNDQLIFVGRGGGTNGVGAIDIFFLSLDKIEPLNIPIISKSLNYVDPSGSTGFVFNKNPTVLVLPHNGTPVILLTAKDSVFNPCWAINLLNKTVTRFNDSLSGRALLPNAATTPILNSSLSDSTPISFTHGRTSGNEPRIYYFDGDLNRDDGTNFTFTVVTDLEDFGTINRKTMSRLSLVGEKPTSTASVDVSWTDDDYQTFNTPVTVDMFQDLPSIKRLGMFRRRALKITGTHNLPFSLKRVEVDINKGGT